MLYRASSLALAGHIQHAEEILSVALSRFHKRNPDGTATTIIMSMELSVTHYLKGNYTEASEALEKARQAAEEHWEDKNHDRFSMINAYDALKVWRKNELSDEVLKLTLNTSIENFKQTYDSGPRQYRNILERLELMR